MNFFQRISKKILIIIIAIVFLLIVGVLALIYFQKNNEELVNIDLHEHSDEEISNIWSESFEEIDSYNIYYTVKGILNNYISMIEGANGDQYIDFDRLEQSRDEIIVELVKDSVKSIYNMFDNGYKEENNITEEKISNLVQKYKQQGDYSTNVKYDLKIKEMYLAEISADIDFIIVNFEINGIEDNMLIKLDFQNSTFSIFGREYLEARGYNKDTKIANMDIDQNRIEENDYNSFDLINTDDKYIVNEYFSEYKAKLLNNTNLAYEILNEDYRKNKYENFEEFNQYVENNYESLQNAYLTKYQINQFDEYKEYVCLDDNNNYYIFIEKSLNDYNVILDTYTVDLKEFIDKYNSSDIPTKVGMNVEKAIEAINDKDYRYVYNKLDETFRNNNFGNLDNFTLYMSQNFYEQNEMEYLEFSEEGGTYIYIAKVKNKQEDESEGKEITIVMKLLEGTDFVMSFSME